ncbi:MAG: hypothetical protein ACRBBU_10365 [Pseudooceanicola sp.]
MSRLILLLILVAALVAAGTLIASAWSRPTSGGAAVPARRGNAIQKAAYVFLVVIMTGVATGWLGAE